MHCIVEFSTMNTKDWLPNNTAQKIQEVTFVNLEFSISVIHQLFIDFCFC